MKKISPGTPPPRSEDQRLKKQEQAGENILFRNKKDDHGFVTANERKAIGTAKKDDNMIKLERKTTEDINESAEAFIQKFRQQLMIQRLESIENYEKMLARGL
ncbi:uncharacterized protein LOC115678425 [Syzygium oleosum]|uniref:uncharacterized protein LOC115678425 n=1 Tax=Syzygium oleosum TaxID=219896 RepID=UPI0011D1C111|nr:uncharacterized protein LOC115678425 [Syzygium oleosum]